MTNFIIRTHRPANKYIGPHFFVLNKGMNSGKPLPQACANCFVVHFELEEDRESYYWLTYSLWKSQFWHRFLVGSVIPFLRILDFKNEFIPQTRIMMEEHEQHLKNVKALKLLQQKETQFHENLVLINDLRRVILYRYHKGR